MGKKKLKRSHQVIDNPDADKESVRRNPANQDHDFATWLRDTSSSHCFSSRLPLATQHELFRYVQYLLEDMCQEYGMRWCAQHMISRRWVEPRSLELQQWVRFISKHTEALPSEYRTRLQMFDSKRLFPKIASIRHASVHRKSIELASILQTLDAARDFASLHQSSPVQYQLAQLVQTVQDVGQTILAQQQMLQSSLTLLLEVLASRHTVLVRSAKGEALAWHERNLNDAADRILISLQPVPDTSQSQQGLCTHEFGASSDIEELLLVAEKTISH